MTSHQPMPAAVPQTPRPAIESQVLELERLWPALRNPAPPETRPLTSGAVSFKVADEWAKLAEQVRLGTFRLRDPAPSPRGLVGPIRGHGRCLEPVFAGDVYYFDPHMPAQDGDFVLVEWHPETLKRIVERGSRKPEWLEMYGENPAPTAIKWLRYVGSEPWLVSRGSMSPLHASPWAGGENRILGVLRYVERDDCGPIYTAAAIDPNAATVVYQADDDGPLDVTAVSASNSEQDWLGTPTAVTIEATTDVVEVTITFDVEITALGTSPSTYTGAFGGTSASAPAYSANIPQKTTAAVEKAASVLTVTGLTPGTHYFGPGTKITHTNGGGDTTVRVRNVETQITIVKR